MKLTRNALGSEKTSRPRTTSTVQAGERLLTPASLPTQPQHRCEFFEGLAKNVLGTESKPPTAHSQAMRAPLQRSVTDEIRRRQPWSSRPNRQVSRLLNVNEDCDWHCCYLKPRNRLGVAKEQARVSEVTLLRRKFWEYRWGHNKYTRPDDINSRITPGRKLACCRLERGQAWLCADPCVVITFARSLFGRPSFFVYTQPLKAA